MKPLFMTNLDNPQPVSSASTYHLTAEEIISLTQEANLGQASSAFRLYLYYAFSQYDNEKRLEWLKVAAERNHAVAQHNLAYDYMYGPTPNAKEAKRWAQLSLDNGNKEAQDLLNKILS